MLWEPTANEPNFYIQENLCRFLDVANMKSRVKDQTQPEASGAKLLDQSFLIIFQILRHLLIDEMKHIVPHTMWFQRIKKR